MKKFLFLATAVTLLFASSCKKKDDSGPSNYWTVNGTKHVVATSTGGGGILGFVENSSATGNLLSFEFGSSSLPTSNGTYKIVNPDNITGSANEVVVMPNYGSGGLVYYPSKGTNANASVTVNGGKISITVPEIWVVNSLTGNDSVKLSANVTQP